MRDTKWRWDGCRINHLLFMDDLKFFVKNEKEIDSLVQTVRIFSDDISMKVGEEMCCDDHEEG